ncbi:solute carrier family 28 member 3-like [Pomacea canaliculata]|uniref:solute carrier family 28 member 3-like n=1 Tax=Pomacea canaliculata TaxID=400727 RepID=UPI000D73D0DD|nr:solute carrier family 28 member 3-like [Pomacea canaliculata]XP_025095467.1 solute carrier family 28 member 3-like [Pomacea canaliculata]XP_025095468.1 solute carrier family 28 member 3-like [Pomacea canaliculata]XP_025095469.1 solute carrier family 28 member 3-like [Pomacea canaliculata]
MMSLTRRTPALGSVAPEDPVANIELDKVKPESENLLESKNGDTPDGEINHVRIILGGESESDDEDAGRTSSNSCIDSIHSAVTDFVSKNSSILKMVFLGMVVGIYAAYFITAIVFHQIYHCLQRPNLTPLVALTCAALFLVSVSFMWTHFGNKFLSKVVKPIHQAVNNHWEILRWVAVLLPVAGIVVIIISTVYKNPENLLSLAGLAIFISLLLISSAFPSKVNWRPVIGGFILQFYFATLILKWDVGYKVFKTIGEGAQKFLSYTDSGSVFVFGEKYRDHFFVMQVLPVMVFFSCVTTILYHLGIMQAIISKMAFVMHFTLGTTAAESLCAAANIFVGLTEAPIMIRPFLPLMTKSELHTVMVGGFATIAGGVLAAYIQFGIPPEHLLCASVMNAPCALAVSKLLYPETKKSKISQVNVIVQTKREYRNLLEAAAAGASLSIALVANVAANLIAFIALLAFVNAAMGWFGAFICYPDLSFQKICRYLLMPVVYLMGVRWEDAGEVAEMVGLKTFLNEFVAYKKLAELIKAKKECIPDQPFLSQRSVTIATYALCGFANLSSIGIMLGGLGPMAPDRVKDMAQIVFRALCGGVVVCLITASIAGLLVVEPPWDHQTSCNASQSATENFTQAGHLISSTISTILTT